MIVQDLKKECVAKTGINVEFSNSELLSISHLLRTVDEAVEETLERAKDVAENTKEKYGEKDKIRAIIDLKPLMRVKWLLDQLACREESRLFEESDFVYKTELTIINDAVEEMIEKGAE